MGNLHRQDSSSCVSNVDALSARSTLLVDPTPPASPPHFESPAHSEPEEPVIPRNGDGVPVFPSLDKRDLSPRALESILVRYFEKVWGTLIFFLTDTTD